MNAPAAEIYRPTNHLRIVTAAALFDGHDAAINIMRRIMQASGAEVVHLGHNRSAAEIVECAIQEDAQGIAITSYQGGHVEFFKYIHDLLHERGADIKIFGGGGGTILPSELAELHAYGIARIYSPDDGRAMGLQGMINDLLRQCDFPVCHKRPKAVLADGTEENETDAQARLNDDSLETLTGKARTRDFQAIARLISMAETEAPQTAPPAPEGGAKSPLFRRGLGEAASFVLGITGTGGAGKSSLVDELVRRHLQTFPGKTIAILSVDPSKRKTGGALLGDRIRMNSIHDPRVYMRSMATRQSNLALSRHVRDAVQICQMAGFDLVIIETSGIGQSDTEITEHAHASLYVMTAEYGAATQLEKIDMLDFADVIAINKFDKAGSTDALRDVRKQYRRNHNLWDTPDESLPVFGTIAAQFNDAGMNRLFERLMLEIVHSRQLADDSQKQETGGLAFSKDTISEAEPESSNSLSCIIPPARNRYLAEIVESAHSYGQFVEQQVSTARKLQQLKSAMDIMGVPQRPHSQPSPEREGSQAPPSGAGGAFWAFFASLEEQLHPDCRKLLARWEETKALYRADTYQYKVRDKIVSQDLHTVSLSGLKIPKISLPRYSDHGDVLRWLLTENVPGEFPFAAGVFPLKREGEDPARMFAGEGGPERTNRRFHYLSAGMPAKRLSTAFDSVTLYGEDPGYRPDIFGKVGNSGVSVCNLDDAKKLYSGFNLCDPATSVSMTINGPAPMMLAFFLNAAIDQQCELHIRQHGLEAHGKTASKIVSFENAKPAYNADLPDGHNGLGLLLLGTTGDQVLPPEVYAKIKADTLKAVRGTVQADILKEDQAQNTCIFSTEFALRMMGDIQQYFIDSQIRNFYSVSISGYHIAEAGANPVSQLAFTLSNGFTLVEYYLSRGMKIDDFAPSLSFFFSNGMDPEYAVLGRVARRIWAKAMKHKYKANERSQKLKYHIQTSGRSLHAQEIAFNDIRTTLQALYAIYDNCNSLHTNAYDEAITTPTEESVRRALAIQLIINHESGLARNENPLQGAFIIEELTDLVEEAVYREFARINDRGGVLGAMERMYQRGKIQDESMHYETLKHNGDLPIIGVNTFLDPQGSPTIIPGEVIRSTDGEKRYAVQYKEAFQQRHATQAEQALQALQQAALQNGNVFASLMEAAKTCTLGQMTQALYAVGGQYRRNM